MSMMGGALFQKAGKLQRRDVHLFFGRMRNEAIISRQEICMKNFFLQIKHSSTFNAYKYSNFIWNDTCRSLEMISINMNSKAIKP